MDACFLIFLEKIKKNNREEIYLKSKTEFNKMIFNKYEINLLETGITSFLDYEDIQDKKYSLIHFFGNFEKRRQLDFWSNRDYPILPNHYVGL